MPIQKLIDDALCTEQEKRKDRITSGKWKPSMLGRCYRAQVWARKNEPVTNPPDKRILRVFAAGKLFHNYVQAFIPNSQVEVKVETADILGYADVVDNETVYDLKSQHSRGFWYMKKKGYDIRKEKHPNWLQVMAYARLLKKPKGALVFISKDDLCVVEYTDYFIRWEEELSHEFFILNKHWKESTLPPAEPRCFNGKECQYCNWKDKCKAMESEVK